MKEQVIWQANPGEGLIKTIKAGSYLLIETTERFLRWNGNTQYVKAEPQRIVVRTPDPV